MAACEGFGSARRYSSTTSVKEAVEEGLLTRVLLGQQEHYECMLCRRSMAGVIPAQAHLKGSQHSKVLRNHSQVRDTSSHFSSPLVSDSARYPTAEFSDPHDEVTAAMVSGVVVATMAGFQKTLTCTVCRSACTGDIPMRQHLQSDAHMKKIKRREEECASETTKIVGPRMTAAGMRMSTMASVLPRVEAPSVEDSLKEAINKGIVVQAGDGDPSHLMCVVCTAICTGEESMKQHVEGRSHQKKLRIQEMNPSSEGPVQTTLPRRFESIERSDFGIRSSCLDETRESSLSLGGSTPLSRESTPVPLRTSSEGDSLQEAINQGIVVQTDNGDSCHLKCVVCTAICTGEEPMKSHINGKAHQKKLRAQGMNPVQATPQSSCFGARTTTSYGERESTPLSSRASTVEIMPVEDEGFFITSEHGFECILCDEFMFSMLDLEEHKQEDSHMHQLRKQVTLFQENLQQSFSSGGGLDTTSTPPPLEGTQTGAGSSRATCVPQVENISRSSMFSHIHTTPQGRTLRNSTPANVQDIKVYLPSDSLADLFC